MSRNIVSEMGEIPLSVVAGPDDVARKVCGILGGDDRSLSRRALDLFGQKLQEAGIDLGSGATTQATTDATTKVAAEAGGKALATTGEKTAATATTKATTTAATKASEKALATTGEKAVTTAAMSGLRAAATGLGVAAGVSTAAQLTETAIDFADPNHEAKSARNGKNVVSEGLSAMVDGIDGVAGAVGKGHKAISDAASSLVGHIPLIGGALSKTIDVSGEIVRTVGGLASSTARDLVSTVEGAVSAVGNEANGARSVTGDEIGEHKVLESDSISEAAAKGGIPGLFEKFTGGAASAEDAAQENLSDATDYVTKLAEEGQLTRGEQAVAATLASTGDGTALVDAVNDIKTGRKDVSQAFAMSTLADEPTATSSVDVEASLR